MSWVSQAGVAATILASSALSNPVKINSPVTIKTPPSTNLNLELSARSGNKLQVSIADQTARFPLREPEARQFRAQLLLRQRLVIVVRAPSLIGRPQFRSTAG